MEVSPYRVATRWLQAQTIAKKPNGRPKGSFYGDEDGVWRYTEGYPLGILKEWDWSASIALSSKNDWKNLSVDGATEHHRGFRKALNEIVRKYPEIIDYTVSFDGPYIPVSRLVSAPPKPREPNWATMVFYHGTSSHVLDAILREGLRPRSQTNVDPAYGVDMGAAAGRVEAVYLTTQESMARYAAVSAARRKGDPVILKVVGLRPNLVAPDEDSREATAVRSLERIGSIAYLGPIPPRSISVYARLSSGRWVK